MKNVILQWKGLGYLDVFQATINIYDSNHCFLFSSKTYNGCLEVCLKTDTIYQIVAISQNEVVIQSIYLDKNRDCYQFYFPRSLYQNNSRKITFHVTDFYYKNLPIEKGEMILWPK